MKYFKFLMLFILMGVLQGCPGEDDGLILINGLTLKNISGETIYYDCYNVSASEVNSSNLYFYQLIELKNNSNYQRCKYYIQQFKTGEEKIWILIYKKSTIENYSWEEIQEQNLYDKRYSFTLDELNAMNWQLVFDGK